MALEEIGIIEKNRRPQPLSIIDKQIFKNYTNPEDKNQIRSLGLHLMTLSYDVWCDVLKLRDTKIWKEVETELITRTRVR